MTLKMLSSFIYCMFYSIFLPLLLCSITITQNFITNFLRKKCIIWEFLSIEQKIMKIND